MAAAQNGDLTYVLRFLLERMKKVSALSQENYSFRVVAKAIIPGMSNPSTIQTAIPIRKLPRKTHHIKKGNAAKIIQGKTLIATLAL